MHFDKCQSPCGAKYEMALKLKTEKAIKCSYDTSKFYEADDSNSKRFPIPFPSIEVYPWYRLEL